MVKSPAVATRLVALLAALALVFCTPSPANAAGEFYRDNDGLVKMRVKSLKQVAGSAIYVHPHTKKKTVLRVVANFTSHTTNSVKITSFMFCYSQTDKAPETLTPRIEVFGKKVWEGATKWDVGSGQCRSWKVNKTFKGKPGKEMFVIKTKVGWAKLTMLHGFYR